MNPPKPLIVADIKAVSEATFSIEERQLPRPLTPGYGYCDPHQQRYTKDYMVGPVIDLYESIKIGDMAMTDLETAREALKPVVVAISTIDSQFKILNAIVGKNQNRPPLGDADGSFSDENWTMLRDIVDAIRTIKQNSPCV